MSNKSILVIDTPSSCKLCCCNCCCGRDSYGELTLCTVKLKSTTEYRRENTKPDWCPLSPIPEKINLRQYTDNTALNIESIIAYQYAQGWNDFREQVMEGNE